jgi:hypothetical protein
MGTTGWALAELDEVEADLWRALRYVSGAEPRVWRSPAARAYRACLDDLGADLHRLVAVVRQARPAVTAAAVTRVPGDPTGGR